MNKKERKCFIDICDQYSMHQTVKLLKDECDDISEIISTAITEQDLVTIICFSIDEELPSLAISILKNVSRSDLAMVDSYNLGEVCELIFDFGDEEQITWLKRFLASEACVELSKQFHKGTRGIVLPKGVRQTIAARAWKVKDEDIPQSNPRKDGKRALQSVPAL